MYYFYKYWDYEKEEKWLNEMSSKGLAMTDYSWCRYVFEEVLKNEYTYRIELLKYYPTHPESISYIKFLEDNGIDCVATYMKWIYLRKKTSEGKFDIYTDIDSKIAHFKRINIFWSALAVVEFAAGFINIIAGIMNLVLNKQLISSNLLIGLVLIIIGILFIKLGYPLRKKIKIGVTEKLKNPWQY